VYAICSEIFVSNGEKAGVITLKTTVVKTQIYFAFTQQNNNKNKNNKNKNKQQQLKGTDVIDVFYHLRFVKESTQVTGSMLVLFRH